jgi:transketolase
VRAAHSEWLGRLFGLPPGPPDSWPPNSPSHGRRSCPPTGTTSSRRCDGRRRCPKAETIATRKASQNALNHLGPALPELLGGSADLTGSNLTDFKGCGALRAGLDGRLEAGRHINYGVREFGMSAIMNGLALHGGFIPYGGTFLTFSDYARNALRMASLMKQRGVRVHPRFHRPGRGRPHPPAGRAHLQPAADSGSWTSGARPTPSSPRWPGRAPSSAATARARCCSRARPCLSSPVPIPSRRPRAAAPMCCAMRQEASAVIIATGSELALALAARDLLADEGVVVRVVSMPSTSVFDRQDVTYKRYVLPDNLPRVAVEAGVTDWWWKYRCEAVVGLDRFGESAPAGALFEHFGFTPRNVADTVLTVLAGRRAALKRHGSHIFDH